MFKQKISFVNIQKNQHNNFQKIKQKKLHHFKNIQTDNVVKHVKQNIKIHNNKKNHIFDETTQIVFRHTPECLPRQINRINVEIVDETNTHNIKSKHRQNNNVVEYKRVRNVRHDITFQIIS